MANPRQFDDRMKKLGKRVESNAERVVKTYCLAFHTAVVLATPVDTGRARANWQVALNQPATAVLDDTDRSGQATIAKGQQVVATYKDGAQLRITNNLPYIDRLNAGHSAQAPAGFFQRAQQVALAASERVNLLGNNPG